MNGRRAKLLKQKGEKRTELREYLVLNNCSNPMSKGTTILKDDVRLENKHAKRLWTREKRVY